MADWADKKAMELSRKHTSQLFDEELVAAALRQVRIDALEEAAKVCDAKEDDWTLQWRKGLKFSAHLEGISDGAGECAAAIRRLKDKQP